MKTNAIEIQSSYTAYLEALHNALDALVVTDIRQRIVPQEEGLLQWCKLCRDAKADNRTMYFVGNGASATMASHMAADFSKNCGCRALAFNDIALMTAVSNDMRYEDCFAMPLERFANPKDVFVTVSSSGNSPNVLKAAKSARTLGLTVVTLSGMREDNASRRLGDLNFWIPADTYGLVESSHQALLHCWLDTYLELYEN